MAHLMMNGPIVRLEAHLPARQAASAYFFTAHEAAVAPLREEEVRY